ncbi:MAG: D-aminoacylase [Pseudomonadota bacterium]
MWDLKITGGTVVDGTGAAPYRGDIAVQQGRIAAIGSDAEGPAARTLDANGQIVTPGFVDIHTHYDGQASWGERLSPSSNLGATTVVMGNCGVGFAPCRPGDRAALIELMEGVEEIPDPVMAEGLPWNWESFPSYLDAIEARARDIDVAVLFPHGPLRVFAMGQRALDREAATDADLERMSELLREGLAAGAVGFSTSRTLVHRTLAGVPVPTYDAATRELKILGENLRGDARHVFQMIADWKDADAEFDILRHIGRETGARGTFTLLIIDSLPTLWREHLQRVESAQASGLDIRPQVLARPLGIMMGLTGSMTPFAAHPTMRTLAEQPLEAQLLELAKPAVKAQILSEAPVQPHVFMKLFGHRFDIMYPMEDPPNYRPDPADSVAARAERAGVTPQSWLYDYLLEDQGRAMIYMPSVNDSDHLPELLTHAHTLPALGDGGAHVGSICDASANIYLLSHWVRERGLLSIEDAVRKITGDAADLYGLTDRGRIETGLKADLNIIDLAQLSLSRPYMVRDLPAGGGRLHQEAKGLSATIVAGEPVYLNNEPTGALPGALVRKGVS